MGDLVALVTCDVAAGDIEVPRPSFNDKLVGSLNVNMADDPEDCISNDEGDGLTFDGDPYCPCV